jgi:SNF2 family DNA or RNA helicase
VNKTINEDNNIDGHTYIFRDFDIENFTENVIAQHTNGLAYFDVQSYQEIIPVSLEINEGAFTKPKGSIAFSIVTVVSRDHQLLIHCTCDHQLDKMCEHQAVVLTAIIQRDELAVFFNATLRDKKLRKFAGDYGLEKEAELDDHFSITYQQKQLIIAPHLPSLIPVTRDSLTAFHTQINNITEESGPAPIDDTERKICVVLKQHKYFHYLQIELYSAATTKGDKIKNPLNNLQPLDFIWQSDSPDHVKFFTGIHKFQSHSDGKRSQSDIDALKSIIKNPAGYDFYYHEDDISENVNAASLVPVKTSLFQGKVTLSVDKKNDFYELSGNLEVGGNVYALKDLEVRYHYFFLAEEVLYLVDQLTVLNIIDFLKKKPENLLIHKSKFAQFRAELLTPLEDKIPVTYQYISTATPEQLEQQGFQQQQQKIIYLSDSGNHITLTPVMMYDDVEIPIRSKRQLYAWDHTGNEFKITRDEEAEVAFTAMLTRQHPWFDEQMDNDLNHFYLHRQQFLDEDWFLNVFEEWNRQGITILGFNELEGNKIDPHKAKVDIKVMSGINWFNAIIQVKFGKKKAGLKNLRKAVKNKSKYVQLDDGTLGIIPAEWLEKFADYFNSGEIEDDETLFIAKTNFSAIEQYYDETLLDQKVRHELNYYRERLAGFEEIKDIEAPEGLLATLRPYQKAGLNWLNFLDDFNFGGCLADDMGLGKSMQIIAFILLQRTKAVKNTNLIVVPATLIFSWEQEIKKYAPSLKLHIIYGSDRIKSIKNFDQYEVILTSYGTLLSDIALLKGYMFNYIFLDESQNIKNPETQRYKAVCLLQARNRIAITGTPIENNTFDLFSQLSFANPGLLGSKQYFKDIYSTPIDTFKVQKRAIELQQKIRPFVLRRTKQEVAPELPEKTEMVLYCAMDTEQRKIYDAYEKEFREQISATTHEELKKNPMNVLKGLTKLRQICDAPALLGNEVLLDTVPAKIAVLMEQIEAKSPEHKILVFSQFVSMLSLIEKELTARDIGNIMLTGSTRNRGAVVNAFQENKDIKVFLISLKAGGTGLNLTQADYVYLVDPWWNPAVENQAIDRVHRIGQDKKVVAVRLICPDTVEEKIMNMQQSKKALANDLIKTDDSFLKSMGKDELLNLLGK